MPHSRPVAIITGVSSGIGQETARLFAQEGWMVVGTVRGGTKVAQLATVSIDFMEAEMTSAADIERVIQRTAKTYGRIDALILNAGYGDLRPIKDFSYVEMGHQLAVNTLAPAYAIKLALPYLRKQKGVVVALSSLAGRIGYAKYSLYSASKFALEGVMESLRFEASEVRWRLIEPGPVTTRFWQSERPPRSSITPDRVARVILKSAQNRGQRLRYPIGAGRLLLLLQRLLPERWFYKLMLRVAALGHRV